MSSHAMADTAPDLTPVRPETSPLPLLPVVDIGALTHAGKVRPNNEDNFHVVHFGRYLRTVLSSLPAGQISEELDRPGYGYVVADGMGGHAAGEIASRTAIALLIELGLRTPDWILGREDALLARIMDRTAERFRTVHETVRARAEDRAALRGMGTTLSVALSIIDELIVAHVGDSPVCLYREGRLHRLTRDHTVAQELAAIDADYAARFRNILTRAIGSNTIKGEPDIARYRLCDGDRLLLCTDGLTDMIDDERIAHELAAGTTSADACRALVDLALDRGGRDNVTVIVATYRIPAGAKPGRP
jgi:serine/threonine protein phosphatase PrpC